MNQKMEPVVFNRNDDNSYEARIADLVVNILLDEANQISGGSISHIEKKMIPPCHEDYGTEPHCPLSKEIDDTEVLEVCERTCPYLTEFEDFGSYTAVMGRFSDVNELMVAIREGLSSYCLQKNLDAVNAFILRDWIVDGETFKGAVAH